MASRDYGQCPSPPELPCLVSPHCINRSLGASSCGYNPTLGCFIIDLTHGVEPSKASSRTTPSSSACASRSAPWRRASSRAHAGSASPFPLSSTHPTHNSAQPVDVVPAPHATNAHGSLLGRGDVRGRVLGPARLRDLLHGRHRGPRGLVVDLCASPSSFPFSLRALMDERCRSWREGRRSWSGF